MVNSASVNKMSKKTLEIAVDFGGGDSRNLPIIHELSSQTIRPLQSSAKLPSIRSNSVVPQRTGPIVKVNKPSNGKILKFTKREA